MTRQEIAARLERIERETIALLQTIRDLRLDVTLGDSVE